MRASACLGLALVSLLGCDGGDGAPCIIDSDCADVSQVCVEQRCQPAGAVPEGGVADSGPSVDSGPPGDSGVMDDSGVAMDGGGEMDGGGDSGVMDCPDAVGSWSVSNILSGPCGAAMTGYVVDVTAGAAVCEFTATSMAGDPPTPALDGSFVLLSDGNFDMAMSNLSVGGDPAIPCSGNLGGDTLTVTCNDGTRTCVMQLAR